MVEIFTYTVFKPIYAKFFRIQNVYFITSVFLQELNSTLICLSCPSL